MWRNLMSTIEVRNEDNKRVLDIIMSEGNKKPQLLIKTSKPIKTYISLERLLTQVPQIALRKLGYIRVS